MTRHKGRDIERDYERASRRRGGSLFDVRQAISSHVVRWLTIIPLIIAGVTMIISLYVPALYSFNLIKNLFFWVFMAFWFFMVAVVYSWVMSNRESRYAEHVAQNTPATQLSRTYTDLSYDQLTNISLLRSDVDDRNT